MAIELKQAGDEIPVTDAELISGGDAETTYTLRRLTIDTWREIARKHTKPATYRKPERRDEEAFQDDLFDYVLKGWTGIVSNGQPAPCDWEHKKLLDLGRRVAMLDRAGMNEIGAQEDARAESFRPMDEVR